MEITRRQQLINQLDGLKNINYKLLSKKLKIMESRSEYSMKEALQDIKVDKKFYKLFLNLVDKDTKKKLIEIDSIIESIEKKIKKESGWYMIGVNNGGEVYWYEDNFRNQHDPEFATKDIYCLYRREDGFEPGTNESSDYYFKSIREEEIRFANRYADELKLLHEKLLEKENIMYGNYVVKEENKDLADSIAKYFGYEKSEKKFNWKER